MLSFWPVPNLASYLPPPRDRHEKHRFLKFNLLRDGAAAFTTSFLNGKFCPRRSLMLWRLSFFASSLWAAVYPNQLWFGFPKRSAQAHTDSTNRNHSRGRNGATERVYCGHSELQRTHTACNKKWSEATMNGEASPKERAGLESFW